MTVDTFFTGAAVDPAAVPGTTAVVIDVIRATSTIMEALANGARAVYPVASTEEAVQLAASLGRDDSLLCGERKGVMIEGFDLGNSPREYTPDVVAEKQLVMTTTNGTRAFVAVQGAERVVSASFLNLSAVVEVAQLLDLTPAQVQDTLSFYQFFCQAAPHGRTRVWVCRSISCALRDGERLLDYLCERLGIRPGETTPDGKVTVEAAECLGACEFAPCMLAGERLLTNMTEEKIDELHDRVQSSKRITSHCQGKRQLA